ncbi:hypothetical protein [Lederbergia galactosidilytica]|uniref:hypothetical protein n=1 Tax=Lederbergia galactosidilytica TaxID=217031 RepID=UPI0007DB65DD|nr:hypothetical protein [Lederbergia galactosidilytica]
MYGWIKLHRKLLSSNIFQNEKLLKIFVYCLMKATHTEYQQIVGKQKVDLKPGQFVFGRRKAALELDMKESTVRDYIKTLKDDNVITITPTNKFSVITIVNWEFYQSKEDDDRQQNDSRMTAKGQQNDTYKNGKNGENEKNKDNTLRSKLKFETHHMKLAELLFKKIKENNPSAQEPNLESWANTFRLMMERDKRTGKDIQDLIIWSQSHHFWYKNILSADKLRKQFDRLQLEMRDETQFKVIKGGKKNETTSRPGDHEQNHERYDFGF